MFNMTDAELLQNGIKIIDGIAGGGKSSKIDQFFRSQDISYERFTSTNRLRRDAMYRFNMPVKTVAAGLFSNHGSYFYAEEKAPSSQYMVIDEILQTSPKAIEWCLNNADNADIIITTDSKQLLSPENEDEMMKAFDDLKTHNNVIYRNVNETLRPRNDKTKEIYHKLYDNADRKILHTLNDIISMFDNVIYYNEMEYNPDDSYITHDNATEDYLYKDKEFTSNPFIELVPKGYLASRPPKDLTKYPLLSQLEATRTHARSYTQALNVGTAVRFQGSEVDDMHKLYFLLQPNSLVSSRELYTVVTRLWDINNLVIVIVDTPAKFNIKTFNGSPVKIHKYLTLNESKETEIMSPKNMDKMLSKYDTDEIYYDRNYVRNYKGNILYTQKDVKPEKFNPRMVTAGSLARRDASINYSYMDEVYSILDEKGIHHIGAIEAGRSHDDYEIDLVSAYPTILKYEYIPTDGIIKTDGPYDNMMNFYIYHKKEDAEMSFSDNVMITDDLAKYIEDNNLGYCEYIFSTPRHKGCFLGDWLYAATHDTIEKKLAIKKQIRYGYYRKPYLKLSYGGECYVKYEEYRYQLLFCAIVSQMLYYLLNIYKAVNGTKLYVDAVQLSCYNPDVVDKVKSVLPDYFDFRIKATGKTYIMVDGEMVESDGILYQSCKPLPTKANKRTEQKRNWKKNMTPEQRAHYNEMQRKRYQEKKERKNHEQKQ